MDSEGEGVPEKTMSVHKGEGVLEPGPRGRKRKRVPLITYDSLDAERKPSNSRLPEVGTQRQTDKIII